MVEPEDADVILEELRELLERQRAIQDRTERVVARLVEELNRDRANSGPPTDAH